MSTQPQYTRDYFIAKFEKIPEEKWTIGSCLRDDGTRCAIGHCGEDTLQGYEHEYHEEARALCRMFPCEYFDDAITDINDGHVAKYPQRTPRARILAALRDLK